MNNMKEVINSHNRKILKAVKVEKNIQNTVTAEIKYVPFERKI